MSSTPVLTPSDARRLAISAQKLDAPLKPASKERMWEVLQRIRCLQLDPIRAVERTQYTVLWSRLGPYDREDLHRLVYEERRLFEYWAHAASIVLTEDYPLHHYLMRRYGRTGSAWSKRITTWVNENMALRDAVLRDIERHGPLLSSQIESDVKVPWSSAGWNNGKGLVYLLDYLWTRGEIMVAQRDGLKRYWDLAERVIPDVAREEIWSDDQVCQAAIERSLRALGVGRQRDINNHFTEKRYPNLSQNLESLVKAEKVMPVEVSGWPDIWYVHADLWPELERIQAGEWAGRTTLLSPFDGLIRDRDRTELMWDFYYRIEIYVPKAKRQFGYYVLPILHGDRLIGRLDPKMDRKTGVLEINGVFTEDGFKRDKASAKAVKAAIHSLARFLEAREVRYQAEIPHGWKQALKSHRVRRKVNTN